MKIISIPLITAILFAGFAVSCNSSIESKKTTLTSKSDSLNYTFGFLQGGSLVAEGIEDIDVRQYLAGFNTALDGDTSLISDAAMQQLIQSFFQELQVEQMQRQADEAEVNIRQGQAFLEENLQNSDVFQTDSGLQYRVIREGDGPRPTATDQVEVHYRGTLLSDEVFDSSYDRGEPVTFPLNRVISGWTEGLQLMSVGSEYQFFIPADLAYGNNPPPGSSIPAGAVLIFDVELLDIK
ncbi:MAG: FKBP-type peptidyl-prolyl cis-trans isomerase [Balneolaceae bacterium]|nr:MAG: FKBP-type peptidyl-prolyl cis-trans isomerase [Balneolaceae bacterium]